jgi:UPF0755 protein
MAKKPKLLRPAIIGILLIGVFLAWLKIETEPSQTPEGPRRYFRYEHSMRISEVLGRLQEQGIIKDARAMEIYALLTRHSLTVSSGTFSFAPGMSATRLLQSLSSPVRQSIRIPETNWAKRTAHYLAERQVLDADEYMRLVHDPSQFKSEVPFPLVGPSLEGYLYPDTYDLPPLLGARAVILRQLKNFDRKVWQKVQPDDMLRTLTIASMVQMESGRSHDLAMIAGVIENRLNKKMPLQIDSTLLYGIQKWRRLTFSDYKGIDSPYNTYTHIGLPPGPICSPTIESIEAALHPAHHDFLYYVALPNGESLFSKDYKEHLKKIKERKHELALRKMLGMKP